MNPAGNPTTVTYSMIPIKEFKVATMAVEPVFTVTLNSDGTFTTSGNLVLAAPMIQSAWAASKAGFSLAALLKLLTDFESGASITIIIADLLAVFAAPAPGAVTPVPPKP